MSIIVDSIKQWLPKLRILPQQTTCVPDTPKYSHQFTPYYFLVALIETTEKVGPDNTETIYLCLKISIIFFFMLIYIGFLELFDNFRNLSK